MLDDYGLAGEWCSILLLSFSRAFGQEYCKPCKGYGNEDKKLIGGYQKAIEGPDAEAKKI